MKFFINKNYFVLLLSFFLLLTTSSFSKESKLKYSQKDLSNYFSGIISISNAHTTSGFKYLNKSQSIKKIHTNFNIQFIRSLIILEKYKRAFEFSKSIWSEEEPLFEADLLLGLESVINKDYLAAQKYFERINNLSGYHIFFEDILGNMLISWVKAFENNKEDSLKFLNKIPKRYNNIIKIQNSFLQCYFDTPNTENAFKKLTSSGDYSFSRYNFFLANYFLSKKEISKAEMLLRSSRELYSSNLLIKQTEELLLTGKKKIIKNFFSCQNPRDLLAEIFYIVANINSTEKNYQLSNFYLKISLFLNNKFIPNKSLLAENFFYQKKYNSAKKIYNSLKSVGSVYSWHSSKSIAIILLETKDKEASTSRLAKEFKLLSNPNFEQHYEFANFYKDNNYHKESIKYYSLALKNLNKDHKLIPKILYRRGTSYERIGDWGNAEKDLTKSLDILPEQAHVLNYLAYSWVEKGIKIQKALKMLKRATNLKQNDGYIIDSLGWAYFANKNYVDAEKFLQRAVELMPRDPVINDHYGDSLFMVNKDIQARYFWKYVLSLDNTKQELKDSIREKMIFGIKRKL